MKYTRKQLIEAQKKYYQTIIDNPEDFENELDGSDEQAEATIDFLLKYVK